MSTAEATTLRLRYEEEKRLLKYLKSRAQVPRIPECDGFHVPRLDNVQGDVLFCFPKRYEHFVFFRITDKDAFKVGLSKFKATSAQDVKKTLLKICEYKASGNHGRLEIRQQQMAFTRTGLCVLGEDGDTGDERFDKRCMKDDQELLGDKAFKVDWDEPFDKKSFDAENGSARNVADPDALHGVVVIAGDTDEDCEESVDKLKKIFGKSWKIPGHDDGIAKGHVRPDPYRHCEHFGYANGISQPAIRDIVHPLPGQTEVDAGVIIMGYPGDPIPKSKRPAWTKDGSIMVFRKLQQSVLDFEQYCKDNGPRWKEFVPGGELAAQSPLNDKEAADLFGARFVGRWKSGAPVALAPIRDDKDLGKDPRRNNDFDYTVVDVPGISAREPSNYYCPFTAHTRKIAPRNLDPYVSRQYLAASSIVRAGIPYGKDVRSSEREEWEEARKENPEAKETEEHRGLLFNCYASHLDSGFIRQMTGYGNNDFFPIAGLTPTKHGRDPIIGENPSFVTPRGGEYFFVPSISTLKSWATPAS